MYSLFSDDVTDIAFIFPLLQSDNCIVDVTRPDAALKGDTVAQLVNRLGYLFLIHEVFNESLDFPQRSSLKNKHTR